MPVRQVECHPYVTENRGRVALMRGPLLYCVEQADNLALDPRAVVLPAAAMFTPEARDDLLGGMMVLRGPAEVDALPADWAQRLYRTARTDTDESSRESVEIVAIPYYAWANREAGRMQVWLRAEAT
jgi:hypothetical protein